MVEMSIEYMGNLRTEIFHGPSGKKIETDAPIDNEGLGERFSPTDMMAASLGACVLTIMGIAARKRRISIDGARVRVEKHMNATPRRVGKIVLEFTLPAALAPEDRSVLQRVSDDCPVRYSINPDIAVVTIYNYE